MKKIFMLLPDGVGLRNFIYTDFIEQQGDNKTVVWTNLSGLNLNNIDIIKLPRYMNSVISDAKRRALTQAELMYSAEEFSNKSYLDYIKPELNNTIKRKFKNRLRDYYLMGSFSSLKKLRKLRNSYINSIENSTYFADCLESLKVEKPDIVFCVNQRNIEALAPVLAAQKLGIPTVTFIYSWDNLPKGILAVEADYYFVWSEYMSAELKKYYPWIKEEQIKVVGTPQFIPYGDESLFQSKEEFFKENNLNVEAKTICFSGDDKTTSPNDQEYLKDLAQCVAELNKKGETQYQILFRRCPVDKSNRYDAVLNEHSECIHVLDPAWSSPEDESAWKQIVPLAEDSALLTNTVRHSDVVINVGSTMALDFAMNGKTACYINYNVPSNNVWNIDKIYKYIHFTTMDGLDPVYWINSKEDMKDTLLEAINDEKSKLKDAQIWAKKIALHPTKDANIRYWNELNSIMEF